MASREKKLKRGKKKKEENYIKKGGKGLKSASFWAINPNLFVREKNESQKKGVGKKIIKMHNIYPCFF